MTENATTVQVDGRNATVTAFGDRAAVVWTEGNVTTAVLVEGSTDRAIEVAGSRLFHPNFRTAGIDVSGRLDPGILLDILSANDVEPTPESDMRRGMDDGSPPVFAIELPGDEVEHGRRPYGFEPAPAGEPRPPRTGETTLQ